MVHVCKDRCKDYKVRKHSRERVRYSEGQKYCTQCAVYLCWEGVWCPCCGHKVRANKRANKLILEEQRHG